MDAVLYMGIALVFFSIFFVLSKQHKLLSGQILIVWMLFLALPLLCQVLSFGALDNSVLINQILLHQPLCSGPFAWLYVQSLTGDIQKIRIYHLGHFLPFMLVALFPILLGGSLEPSASPPLPNNHDHQLIDAINIIVHLSYSGIIFWRLGRHRFEVLQHFSMLSTQVTLKWLNWLTCGFAIAYLFPLLASILSLPIAPRSHDIPLVAFISVLSFFGLKQTQEFSRAEDNDDAARTEYAIQPESSLLTKVTNTRSQYTKERYEHSGLTEEQANEHLKRLEDYMHCEKPYLDANLTMDKLATPLKIPKHHLTQIFSEQLNKNFYLFINEYRIHAVQQQLREPQNEGMTVLDVAYKSGFNSKSTFNTAFKKIAHMTPSQYRKSAVLISREKLEQMNIS